MRFVRPRPRRRLAVGAVVTLVALGGFGGLWHRSGDERAGQEALRRAEHAAAAGRAVAFAELLDTHFDRLVVVRGTAGADDIRGAVGADWRRADELAYHCCDPAPIWAFVDDDQVVAFFRPSFEMSYGDQVRPGSYGPNERVSLSAPLGASPRVVHG